MTEIVLTPGQQDGFDLFGRFYLDPLETVMVLEGFSGTGKSTLVKHILNNLTHLDGLMKLIDPGFIPYDISLTATTNQAAEALAIAIDGLVDTQTIHSKLGLIVRPNYKTGKKELIINQKADKTRHTLLFVDEASYIDQHCMSLIFKQIENCKIVFIGDPAQLTPVGSYYMPAFEFNQNRIKLTKVMRQEDDSPLAPLIAALRETVLNGPWPKISLSPGVITHQDQDNFEAFAYEVFSNPEKYGSAKILAYTNDRVEYYNKKLSSQILGNSEPHETQRMVANEMATNGASTVKNGEEVLLMSVKPTTEFGVDGYEVILRGRAGEYFLPKYRHDKKKRIAQARADEDYSAVRLIEDSWIDLRPTFACTVNKSQGSTFDVVLVDLNDICRRVRVPNQLARMLYVGFSRARSAIHLTGDM